MRLAPRTLLVRVFLLIAALLVISVGAWLALFHAAEREPRARQLAQLVASVANISRAALIHADPENRVELIRELSESEGLRLLPADPSDRIQALPDSPFLQLFADEVQQRMGRRSRLAHAINGERGIWASFWIGADDLADEYWLGLPEGRIDPGIARHWIGWGLLALGLALFVAWLIVSRIARPLRAIAAAATEIGGGRTPAPLAETGADELAHVAAAFNRMSSDLSRVAAERAEVLAGISHDLRTPIARLRLDVEMSVPDGESRAAMAGDLEQMDGIIGQFLDYARGIEAEAPARHDACELIALVAERRSGHGEAPACRCTGPLPVTVRRTAILRALTNLVDNAYKYGGGAVEIAASQTGAECVFEVRDRGVGIPAHEIERLKRPFTRLDEARSDVRGTGLGLAIVERVAAGHGGALDLLAAPDGGLIARLRIPNPPAAG